MCYGHYRVRQTGRWYTPSGGWASLRHRRSDVFGSSIYHQSNSSIDEKPLSPFTLAASANHRFDSFTLLAHAAFEQRSPKLLVSNFYDNRPIYIQFSLPSGYPSLAGYFVGATPSFAIMDINSLLSPQSQSSPQRSPSQSPQQPHVLPKNRLRQDGKRTPSTLSNEVLFSPPANPPRSAPNDDAIYGHQAVSHSPMSGMPTVRTPIDDKQSASRSPSGPANMQNTRFQSATPQADIPRSSPAMNNARAAAPPFGRTYSASDLIMAEAPAQTPVPRAYSTTSLTAEDLESVTTMTGNLAKNSYDYESHVALINLLHQGFISHIASDDETDSVDPADYALLADLRQAREAMDSRFAVGEEMWRDWISDESRLAKVSEDRSAVLELCQKAVQEEPASISLWTLYGEWAWDTYSIANDLPNAPKSIMSEDDKLICKEIFNRDVVLTVWRNAVTATRWRIDESHRIWNRYAQIVMQDFPDDAPRQVLEEGRSLYMTRLQLPHVAWDQTLQDQFWPFVSKHYPDDWSDIIAATKEQAAPAQQALLVRESHEDRVTEALRSQDSTELYSTFASYIDWESRRKKKPTTFDADLRCMVYERALLRFPTVIEWWLDYIEYRISLRSGNILSLIERATRHCPWSGELWSRRMLQAEIEGRSFNEIESVNLKAGNSGLLETGGVNEMLNVHATWCNYLRRRAFGPQSTEDAFDMAELGIPQVIEGAQITIRKFLGDDYKGDPSWRMEKIYIEFLTRARRLADARTLWKTLVPLQKHSYDFWTRYYNWEMSAWSTERVMTGISADIASNDPTLACHVITTAFKQEELDWPEKVHDVYAYHYYTHHSPEDIQQAEADLRCAQKHLRKRREREALIQAGVDAAAARAQQEAATAAAATDAGASKRKRGDDSDAYGADAVKRSKVEAEETHAEGVTEAVKQAKRDREHSTATVRGLPSDVTEKQVRRFFQDCGKIKDVSIKPDTDATTASCTIEFETHEDVLSARTRDGKELDGHSLRVTSGAMSTLYVANYPAEYNEQQIRALFSSYGSIVSVRFPSLKYNARRRFCYVQFLTDEEALAATEMDSKAIDGQHTLLAKISDPERKANRMGALAEGREVLVKNLHFSTTDSKLRDLFKECGTIQSIRLIKAANGKFRGTAFLVFASAVSTARIL